MPEPRPRGNGDRALGGHQPTHVSAVSWRGLISQFEGYQSLAELDWERYRARYRNIQRLDLILEAENDSPNRYKLAKQADVLMLFYVFSAEELTELFEGTRLHLRRRNDSPTVAYYDARSSHGSTLSRVVHAWVLARSDRAARRRILPRRCKAT